MPGCISPLPPPKKYQFVDVKKQNVLFILDEDKTPKSSETKMFFRRFFQDKKIFFLIIHLFFLSGSCKTCTSDVVISVLCCKLAEILDLRKIKQSTPECNETLHCNGKGKILHMIFFSTPAQILQLLYLHYIWHHCSVQRSGIIKNAVDFCV